MKDNPGAFDDNNTPFILCYSIIMLNVDAHSKKLVQKNKMKKNEFVQNNMKICPGTPQEYLEGIYDRIVDSHFEHLEKTFEVLEEVLNDYRSKIKYLTSQKYSFTMTLLV